MYQKITRITLSALALVFLGLVGVEGVDESEEEGERVFIRRPEKPRPKLHAEVRDGISDGFYYQDMYLKNDHVEIKMPALEGWYLDKKANRDSVSFIKMHGQKGQERVELSLYREGELLKDIRLGTLKGYVDLLKREFAGKKVEVLNEEADFKRRHTFFILGKTYRVVEFKTISGDEVEYYRDYIVQGFHAKYRLAVIRHKGPPKFVEKSTAKLEESLRFSVVMTKQMEEDEASESGMI